MKLKDLMVEHIFEKKIPENGVSSIRKLPLMEMTYKYSYPFDEETGVTNIVYLQQHGKYTGDQDGKRILGIRFKKNNGNYYLYGIENDEKITSIIVFHIEKHIKQKFAVIDVVFSLPEFRNKNDMRRILWFIKSQEHLSLMSGGIESNDAVKFIDKIFNSAQFGPKWFNIETGEIKDYTDTSEKFRSVENKTQWRIIAEGFNDNNWNKCRFDDKGPGPIINLPKIFDEEID